MLKIVLTITVQCVLLYLSFNPLCNGEQIPEPVVMGNNRELFVDDHLVASLDNVSFCVHEPEREEISIVLDQPWEGCGCGYSTVLYDTELKRYRIYYKSWQHSHVPLGKNHKDGTVRVAVIESEDGIHWTRPNLGIIDYYGNSENNLILSPWCDFSPFIDQNPNCRPEERYKALGHTGDATGLYALASPDGIHWKKLKEEHVFSKGPFESKFDSQNVAFWSAVENQYVGYFRTSKDWVRYVDRIVSKDFVNWTYDGALVFKEGEGPMPRAQYYVNQIFPYYRAPQLYIGFPARYVDNGLTESTKLLPGWNLREERSKKELRAGTAITDSVFITSRDGHNFRQSNDVFLRPGLRTKDNWSYGDNYLTWNVVETESPDADSPRELSLYATESYLTGEETIFRRYSLRIDGFCSLHAKNEQGVVTTKPLTFNGNELSINYRTSAAGLLYIELCDETGTALAGFEKEDCDVLYGDSLDRVVSWKGNKDVSSLSGKPVVLKFYLQEADVYSIKFNP